MRAGFYKDSSLSPIPATVVGLASFMRLGLVRMTGNQSTDQMTEIIAVVVRSHKTQIGDEPVVDWLALPDSNVDYAQLSGTEDWGSHTLNAVDFRLEIQSTTDGESIFQTAEPELVRFDKLARYFTCSTSGVWHSIWIGAMNPGESYKIYTLELTVIDAGRLL